ncbi:MAG: hypothetical protein KJ749_06420 [Planctomycetes bacterium]|nr:hypothetical protein [Planctomycetota bacterium]
MQAAVPALTFSFPIVVLLSGFGCLNASRDQPSATGEQGRSRVILRGTVIRKEWTKTYESWNTDGSEYYILDVGDVLVRL